MTTQASSSTNPYASLISQNITTVASFRLESGVELRDVPVAWKTWGKLNETRDNCMVICHALTGSADVEDWWGPLLGLDKAFDPTRFFIFCANVIGSPYGTVSSVTINPDTGRPYGPEMPGSGVKDDVRLQYHILQQLGVQSVAAVVGGSMGGMTSLEYAMLTPPGFVKSVIPLATSARHSAWCISWGEAQRQSIYSDPDYKDGYYYDLPDGKLDLGHQPHRGLSAARMAALLTYRSRDSFESRFGRRAGVGKTSKVPKGGIRIMGGPKTTNPADPSEAELAKEPRLRAWEEHNDGHRSRLDRKNSSGSSMSRAKEKEDSSDEDRGASPVSPTNGHNGHPSFSGAGADRPPSSPFSAQSYLRYQGDKFTGRFDANCYIHITRNEMDCLSAHLPHHDPEDSQDALNSLAHALSLLPPTLVIGIESDGLFTTTEQKEIAAHIPDAELVVIPSPDGHDGFLLEFEAINGWVDGWLRRKIPQFFNRERVIGLEEYNSDQQHGTNGFGVKKESVFGEAEADVSRW